MWLATWLAAQAEPHSVCDPASLPAGVYLLTMSPGPFPATFGHSALVLLDPDDPLRSQVVDYGLFSGSPVSVAVAQLTGRQRFRVGHHVLNTYVERARALGTDVWLQELALDRPQIGALVQRMREDLESSYPYHWSGPSCTTRVRDILDEAVEGQLSAQSGAPGPGRAQEVLRISADELPLWFVFHWGAGAAARTPVSVWDGAFVPDRLAASAAAWTVRGEDGRVHPLVTASCAVVDGPGSGPRSMPPRREGALAATGIGLAAGLFALRRWARWAMGAFGLALGGFGTATLAIGLLGTFAPGWGFHNLALASPLSFALFAAAIRPSRGTVGAGVAVVGLAIVGWAVSAARGFADGNLGLFLLVVPPVAVALGACLTIRSAEPDAPVLKRVAFPCSTSTAP